MANNECSGPALAVYLAQWLLQKKTRRYTYRFVFVPETIGSICYLSRHKDELKAHVIAGFNLSCVGDHYHYSIVESRYGNTLADRALKNILRDHCGDYQRYSLKRGSDERQYNAPGIDLPVVTFCRSKYGEYPQYHTSADNMDFISPEGFQGSFEVMTKVTELLEYNKYYQVQVLCEPQLGKRGLYPAVSRKGQYDAVYGMTTLIAYADGTNDLIAISDRIGCSADMLIPVVKQLVQAGLLKATGEPCTTASGCRRTSMNEQHKPVHHVLEFIEQAAAKHPAQPAFSDCHTSVSYADLQKQAQTIGYSISMQVFATRRPIVVFMEKCVECLTAFSVLPQAEIFMYV